MLIMRCLFEMERTIPGIFFVTFKAILAKLSAIIFQNYLPLGLCPTLMIFLKKCELEKTQWLLRKITSGKEEGRGGEGVKKVNFC